MKNNTLITLLLSVFIAFLGIGIIVPVLPAFAKNLGATGLELAMIIAVFSITRATLLPLVGNLSDRLGRKYFLAAGLLIYGIMGLLIPLATSVGSLIFFRGLHGLGSSMIVPIAMAYMSLLSPAGSEGRYMSYLNIAVFCGTGCGPVIGGIIYDLFGLVAVFHLMALLSGGAFILVLLQMPSHTVQDPRQHTGLLKNLGNMLHSPKTVGILLARLGSMITMVPTTAFLPLIMADWADTTGFKIGIVIACRTLINAVFQIPFGKLADTFPKLPTLLVSGTLVAITIFSIPQVDNFVAMLLLYLLLGIEEAAVWAVLGAYASIEAKEKYGHGTMMGIYSMAMSGGVLSGALLTGFSMDHIGLPSAYRVAGAAIFFTILLATYLLTRRDT